MRKFSEKFSKLSEKFCEVSENARGKQLTRAQCAFERWWAMTRTSTGPKPKAAKKDFDRSNEIAARLILERPWAFGGEQSFPVVWARLLVRRLELQRKITRRESAA